MLNNLEYQKLDTRLGPLAWRSSGRGPTLVFFAGALANHDLRRDVIADLQDRYRCITIDLPLGAHPWPLLAPADRSATSLARLLLDCLELLEAQNATVIANDTAGGLPLLSLATGHPALERVDRLVLTNCESYDQFPPDALKNAAALARRVPASPVNCFASSSDSLRHRQGGRNSSLPSLRPGSTASAPNRSSGRHDGTVESPTISSQPWPASIPNSSSIPPRDPALRPTGSLGVGRLVRLLPDERRPPPGFQLPRRHVGERSRSQDLGPGRQPRRGRRRHPRLRSHSGVVTLLRPEAIATLTGRLGRPVARSDVTVHSRVPN